MSHPSDRLVRLLLVSDLLTMLALMVGQVALPWWISGQGGAGDLALYGVITSAAAILAMPALSPLGDRLPKREVLVGGLLIFLLAALLLAGMAAWGHYHFGGVVAVGVLAVFANAAVMPTMLSIVPDLVPAERMPAALSLQKSAQAIGRMIGPALGGLVLAATGTAPTFACYALMLLVAVVAAARIRTPAAPHLRRQAGWWQDLHAGLRAKWCVPLDRYWTLIVCVMMIFFLPAIGMLVPLRIRSVGLSAAWLGGCEAALSVGMLVGSAWLANYLSRTWGRVPAMFGALAACGVAMLGIGLVSSPWALAALFGMVGLCLAVTQLVGQTHRLLAIPDHYRARITAANVMTAQIAGSLGPALAGVLLATWQTGTAYLVMGVGFLATTVAMAAVPGLRNFLALDHESVKGWYARQHPEAFDPAV